VVMLLAYGDGFGKACANIFANFGTKLMILVPGRTSMQAGGEKAGTQVRFTLEDVDTLTTNLPQITHITPEVDKQCNVQFDTRSFIFDVTGDYPNVDSVRALKLGSGRFFNMQDQMQRARVAVIGSEAKEKLFSGRNALGERIRVDGLSFEVIGVLSAKMQEGDDDINRAVYVPFTSMSDLKDTHYLDSIWFNYETPDYERLINVVHDAALAAGKRLCGPFSWRDRPDFTCFQNASETAAIARGVAAVKFLADGTQTEMPLADLAARLAVT